MLQNVNVLVMGASQGLHGGSQSGRLFASVPGRGRCSGFVAFALTMGREGEVTPVGTNGQRPWMFCAPKDSDLGFLLPALPMGRGGITGCPTIFTSPSFPEPLPDPSRMLSSDAGRERPFLFGEGVRDVGCVPGKDSSFLFPGAKLLPYFRGLLLF